MQVNTVKKQQKHVSFNVLVPCICLQLFNKHHWVHFAVALGGTISDCSPRIEFL